MEFKHKTLGNGLTIVGEANKGAKSAAVGFFVRTGSRDENSEISGVSHFLEHMLFKGTDKLSALEVNEAFDRTGAQFNAFTSEENTVYYAAVLPEYLIEVTELWAQLMRPALRDDDFSIEKNVIKEEIAMYKDLPSYDIIDRCRNLHFDGHPCGNSVLGTNESIGGMTSGQMREYFGRRYAPNNMVAAFAGHFDWEQVCRSVESRCGSWTSAEVGRKLEHFGGSKKQGRTEKANLVREHICLMSAAVSAQDERRYAASLLAEIVGDDVGSRFFWALVDKALAETATMNFESMDGTGIFESYISCSSENASKVLDAVQRVFADISSKGVTEDELRAAKNKTLSSLVLKNELPMGRLVEVGFEWVYLKEYRPIEEEIAAIKAVRVEDIVELIAEYKPSKFTQYSMGPGKNG
jgi:predicted Zn-dependent peptidase